MYINYNIDYNSKSIVSMSDPENLGIGIVCIMNAPKQYLAILFCFSDEVIYCLHGEVFIDLHWVETLPSDYVMLSVFREERN